MPDQLSESPGRLEELERVAVGVRPAAPLVVDHLEVLVVAVRQERGGVDELDLHRDAGLGELRLHHLGFLDVDRDVVRRDAEREPARLAALGELRLDLREVALRRRECCCRTPSSRAGSARSTARRRRARPPLTIWSMSSAVGHRLAQRLVVERRLRVVQHVAERRERRHVDDDHVLVGLDRRHVPRLDVVHHVDLARLEARQLDGVVRDRAVADLVEVRARLLVPVAVVALQRM